MIKLKFDSFWKGFNYEDNFFTRLFKKFNVDYKIVDQNPDILIFSVFKSDKYIERHIIGRWHFVKKIFFTGENKRPRKDVELNLTFDYTEDNNFRLPLWIWYFQAYNLPTNFTLKPKNTNDFCSYVYSRPKGDRNKICEIFQKYKFVGCGGGCLNNVGGKVQNKIEFQKKYKFCLAIEHTKYPGYITEKILEAYVSNSIPIYFGSETIVKEFNPETFINANNFKNINEVLNYVKKVDNDANLYNSYMNKPILSSEWINKLNDESYLTKLLDKILEGIKSN
jgi:hypothetical protein